MSDEDTHFWSFLLHAANEHLVFTLCLVLSRSSSLITAVFVLSNLTIAVLMLKEIALTKILVFLVRNVIYLWTIPKYSQMLSQHFTEKSRVEYTVETSREDHEEKSALDKVSLLVARFPLCLRYYDYRDAMLKGKKLTKK